MNSQMINRIKPPLFSLLLMLASTVLMPAWADSSSGQSAEQTVSTNEKQAALNDLFDQLAQSKSKAEATKYADQIWQHWFHTDNPEVNDLLRRVQELRRQQRNKQALIVSDRIVSRFPEYSEGWNQRATMFYVVGDLESSLADIEQTLLREPRHFGALAGRALIELAQGKRKEAEATMRKALRVHPFLSEKAILGQAV